MYKLYFIFKRLQKKNNSIIIRKLIDRIEWYYNIFVVNKYQKNSSNEYGLYKGDRDKKIIISLTSYPKRINTIWITIETLLRQSVKPDKIILWLAESQFEGELALPENLLQLKTRGLSIKFCDDLKSHKKYYYTMQQYPEDIIILVDDDMFYPKDMIEQLIKLHNKYPKDICTSSAQIITPSFKTVPSLWRNPLLNEKNIHSDKIQIFTGSGSLYPPHSLDMDVFNKELIKSLCPYADDLWLTFMAYKKGTKISTLYPWRAFPITIYGTSQDSLWYINAEAGQNDIQWKSIIDYYGEKNDKKSD